MTGESIVNICFFGDPESANPRYGFYLGYNWFLYLFLTHFMGF